MQKKLLTVFAIALIAIPCIYLSAAYKYLPPTVATHFGIDGKPDGYSSKSAFIIIIITLSILNLATYLLVTNLHKIDPKKTAKLSRNTMEKVSLAVVILISAVAIMIIYSAVNNRFTLEKVLLPLLGLFFAFMGNVMYSIKPNYFVGIRTPWALEDEETWRKTHQLAGKLWFAGGIIITLNTLLLPPTYALISMIAITAVITLVPAIYSYSYYQSHKNNLNK